jgi:hypothetical protein
MRFNPDYVRQGLYYSPEDSIGDILEGCEGGPVDGRWGEHILIIKRVGGVPKKERIKGFINIASGMLQAAHEFSRNLPDKEMAPDFKALIYKLENTLGYLDGCSSAEDYTSMEVYDKEEFKRRLKF